MGSKRYAILEKIARGEITVQQGDLLLTQTRRLQGDSLSFELDRIATIPPEELERLVATKIAIRNGRQMRRNSANLAES